MIRVDRNKSDTHQIILRFELEEMQQFRALVCTGNRKTHLSLPLLAAYLDEHTLPAEIGELTLPNLVDRECIAKDPEHPAPL